MRLFRCRNCEQTVFFENNLCGNCGYVLGYLAPSQEMVTLTADGDRYLRLNSDEGYRYCDNAAHQACNWLIPEESEDRFCTACRHNKLIPDISIPENLEQWQRMEIAKHRLFYTLIALDLPLRDYNEDQDHGLAFEFLPDPPTPGVRTLTGHDEGLITINLDEADDAIREKFRLDMGEPYRTLLGHFRHEVGHYFWDVLLRDGGDLDGFRAVFGDETRDYNEALQAHYQNGPPPDWALNYISAYAASHPWEDFAESWAHYLHIIDTLETASAFGLRIHPRADKRGLLQAEIDFQPHKDVDFEQIMSAWLPLTVALNSLNRSMGMNDLYPFTLAPAVIEKLGYIHRLVHHRAERPREIEDAQDVAPPPPPMPEAPDLNQSVT
jgi:hypothetical protein